MFPTKLRNNFCVEQCPMLIGIMRLYVENRKDSLTSEYQFKVLLKSDILIRTREKSSRESVLNELSIFKQECNENEQALVS